MSTESGPAEIDALLARLPQWTPPPDFAARLAAAAARQSRQPATTPPTAGAWLLHRLASRAALILRSVLLALVLAWTPWALITLNPLFPWFFSASCAALGSLMTLRLIRS